MDYNRYASIIIEQQDTICYICDIDTYELMYVSPAGRRIVGAVSDAGWLGHKCYKLIQGRDAPCPFCTNSKLRQGEKYCWEFFNPNLQRYVALEDTLVDIDGKLCRLEMATDITDQKMAIHELKNQLTAEEALVHCIQTLTLESDMKLAIDRLLENICKFYAGSRAYIFEYEFENKIIKNTYEWCAEGVSHEIENLQNIPIEYIAGWNRMFAERGEFFITSLSGELDHNSEEYRILDAQGIKSLIAAPLLKDEKIIGFLGVDDPTVNTEDKTLLRSVTCFALADIEKRRLLKQLEYMSYNDALTGLQNRNKYIDVLQSYNERQPERLGILFLDLNGMKAANDSYGHAYGDYLLSHAAEILRRNMGDNSFRIGGDEFVSLCENISKEEFEKRVDSLRCEVREDKDCSAAVGFVWKSGDFSFNEGISYAERLMYSEKQDYYRHILDHGREHRIGVSGQVWEEIDNGRFVVHLQPVVELESGMIVGAEALVRKVGTEGRLIAPDKFISQYEVEGVIWHVDFYVFETVCSMLNRWLKAGISLKVSVNFSRYTLIKPSLVHDLLSICERHGVSPKMLNIEVTESVSQVDRDQLAKIVDDLKSAGFFIVLDDFGTKYSNLSILSAVDFDWVKLDKSLVADIEYNIRSRMVVKETLRMCGDFNGTKLLAEGIETEGQLKLLNGYRCDYGQGFYFSKPLPIEDFEELYREGSFLPRMDSGAQPAGYLKN